MLKKNHLNFVRERKKEISNLQNKIVSKLTKNKLPQLKRYMFLKYIYIYLPLLIYVGE